MRAFIIRPFGTKKRMNFDRVEELLIDPALKQIGAEGRTTIEILEAGNIRIDMFQQLLVADLVVADISINNANVFYELGIRHALRDKRTFLIRARTTSPIAASEQAADGRPPVSQPDVDEVPFDLKTDRYLEYDPNDPGATLPKLADGLAQTALSERQDSPVFLSLPNLKLQDRSQFTPVPLGFGEEVQRAEKANDPAKLTLLSFEAPGFIWESEGLRVVGRALFLIKQHGAGKIAWENLRKLDDLDLEANIRLGNIYQRLGDLTSSNQALERALKRAVQPNDLAEVHAQLGRNKKQLWKDSWRNATAENQAEQAFWSPLLLEAYEQYIEAYSQDLNSYYPGINALALAVVITELADRFPAVWNDRFSDPSEATQKLAKVGEQRQQLAKALQICLDAAERRGGTNDPWLQVTIADHKLLTLPSAGPARWAYAKALGFQNDFVRDAAYNQLQMLDDLGVLKSNVEKALEIVQPSGQDGLTAPTIDRLILFTGHRIDSADRRNPRFPKSAETLAREAIRAELQQEKALASGAMLGVSGAANGGDILFLELCEELSIPTQILLPLPVDRFIETSVKSDDNSWVSRFHTLLQKNKNTPILSDSEELPKWLQAKKGYDIWQRNNLWLISYALAAAPSHLTLMALWDGEPGDGPGGTEHMVAIARQRGARVIHLETKKLFHLQNAGDLNRT